MKSLDAKLAEIKANPSSKAFIIADAKDADMAFGVRAPGPRSYLSLRGERPARFSPEIWTRDEYGYRNLPEFLDIIREVTQQGLVDIMLMSAYVNEQLTIKEGLFRNSHVTPAARANDATDVWAVRHGCYTREAAQPFRTAAIDQIQCGKIECDRSTNEFPGANLGLYSVTFVNDLEQDRETLLAFKVFREEAERKSFRYFLEVFDPNVSIGVAPEKLGEYINDNIIRSLAGVPESGRPLFLKIVYHGPRAMEELAQYDPNVVVGILGGSAGTTYDAFKLIHDAQKYGARVALFGRKINNAEHQLAFIEMLRLITEQKISPEEAVRAYHGVLQAKSIKPKLPLEKDLELTDQSMCYEGSGTRRTTIEVRSHSAAPNAPLAPVTANSISGEWPKLANGAPDFSKMNPIQRLAYDQVRLRKKFG
jgi:DhnA-type fructose-1,6-bisphosphate aldolase and related enzymes